MGIAPTPCRAGGSLTDEQRSGISLSSKECAKLTVSHSHPGFASALVKLVCTSG